MTSRVVIVGGGIAGLSAAEALSQTESFSNGELEVLLLESRRMTGGRAGSFVEPATQQAVDYCQHVAMGCCTELLALLDRVGLQSEFERYNELTFYHPKHGFSRFRPSNWLPPPLHLNAALSSMKHLSFRNKRQIRSALWRLMRTQEDTLRDVTAGDWLRDAGQDDGIQKLFWDVILVSALGDIPDRVSMAAARKVMIDGFAGARGASDVWVPRRPLAEIFGGQFCDALDSRGVRIRPGSSVRSIDRSMDHGKSNDRPWQVEMNGDEKMSADHVIVATPWHVSRRWFPKLWPGDGFESSPITGLHLWLQRPLTPLPHVVMVGTLSHWLFREPLAADENESHGVYHQVVISGKHRGSDWPKERLVQAVVKELHHAFPDAGDPALLRSRVVTDPHAVFSISPQTMACRPPSRTPHAGLHLAGDAIATGWPATMEGAVISGQMAANSVLASRGESTQMRLPQGLARGWLARRLIR